MSNVKYAKLKVDPTTKKSSLEYAPSSIVIRGKGVIGNPSKRDYLEAGWKEVTGVKPPERPGYHVIVEGYEENETDIVALYNYEEDPVIPRHWTPLSIKRAVDSIDINEAGQDMTLWTLLRQMLVEMNYLEDFWGSQYIAEDDGAFKVAYAKACEKFGQDMIDNVIAGIPTENM